MAATASTTTAMGSSFHTTLKCLRFSNLRIISPIRFPSTLSQSYSAAAVVEALPICAAVASQPKGRAARVSAAVAQEELAVTGAEQEEEVVMEEVESSAGGDDDQVVDQVDQASLNTKLYFGNLPYSVDSAQLAGIIQDHGSPELIEVLYNRDTGRSRGFAFVTMSSIEDCNTVIEGLDGSQYMGRILRVNFADKPKAKEPLYPESEHKLFVGNLSWSVTSESLTRAFQGYGNVVGARVLYDGETGKSRGYGFVCYSTRAEMETALEALNGVELEGRTMRVSLAEGKRS